MPPHRVAVRPVHLPGLHATEAASAIAFARHTHDRFGVGLIRRGAQRSTSGRGPVEAGPGDVIAVNPGEVHDGAPLGGAPRAWRMLYFDPALVRAAAVEAGVLAPGLVELRRPVLRDAALARAFGRLFRAATDGGADPLAREEALAGLLAALISRNASARPPPVAPPAGIARARRRIEEDPAAPVTLAGLAAEAGLSRFGLLRAFARETGLPPHAYRLSLRVQLARRRIEAGTPLAEAALASGFADQSHMNRAFLRHTGATPGAWAAARA